MTGGLGTGARVLDEPATHDGIVRLSRAVGLPARRLEARADFLVRDGERVAMISAIRAGAPFSKWRMTSASGRIALRVRAVSSSVSPLRTDECSTGRVTTCAPSRWAATANDISVRVEFS